MPSLIHAFSCLKTMPRLSTNGADGVVYRVTSDIVFKAPYSFANPTQGHLEMQTESKQSIERECKVFEILDPAMHRNIIRHILSIPEGSS
jgi:hypothetical protein